MRILEGATNKDIYISIRDMISETYYKVKLSSVFVGGVESI